MNEAADASAQVIAGHRFSREHVFTAEEASAFSTAAGDDNPLHHDAEFAATTRFGGLIVSGTHTTALLLGLTASYFAKLGSVVGVRFSVAFQRPVHADESVLLEWVVDGIRAKPNGNGRLVDMTGSLRNREGEVCVSATGTVLIGAR